MTKRHMSQGKSIMFAIVHNSYKINSTRNLKCLASSILKIWLDIQNLKCRSP